MKPYKSKSGKSSGVTAYETGKDFILVQFRDKSVYKYSYASCGKRHVDTMIKHAKAQQGLSTYISRNAPDFEQL